MERNYGFGIYEISGGRFDSNASFVVADPLDDECGFFVECASLNEARRELRDHVQNVCNV